MKNSPRYRFYVWNNERESQRMRSEKFAWKAYNNPRSHAGQLSNLLVEEDKILRRISTQRARKIHPTFLRNEKLEKDKRTRIGKVHGYFVIFRVVGVTSDS